MKNTKKAVVKKQQETTKTMAGEMTVNCSLRLSHDSTYSGLSGLFLYYGEPMKTRQRLELKHHKRIDWAEGREQKADGLLKQNEPYKNDTAFNTQPGHIPERARVIRRTEKAFEHLDMAEYHKSKAEGLENQLNKSIFSDDDNAVEALQGRIDDNEAQAARIKAYNKSCRDAVKNKEQHGDLSLLSEEQKNKLIQIVKVCPFQIGPGGKFPGYALQNLRGRITTDRKRIENIKK